MPEHDFLVYFPESLEADVEVLTMQGSLYVKQALTACAAQYGLAVGKNTRLIAVGPHR